MQNEAQKMFEIDGEKISIEELINTFKEQKEEKKSAYKAKQKRDDEKELKPYQA